MTDNAGRERRTEGYEPRFDLDLDYGRHGELVVSDIAEAVRNQSIEVKRDAMWAKTGNLYVEYACLKFNGKWEWSGIKTTTATLYAFVLGDTETTLFVPTGLLLEWCRELLAKSDVFKGECKRGSHPTKGVKVPVRWLIDRLAKHDADAKRGAA